MRSVRTFVVTASRETRRRHGPFHQRLRSRVVAVFCCVCVPTRGGAGLSGVGHDQRTTKAAQQRRPTAPPPAMAASVVNAVVVPSLDPAARNHRKAIASRAGREARVRRLGTALRAAKTRHVTTRSANSPRRHRCPPQSLSAPRSSSSSIASRPTHPAFLASFFLPGQAQHAGGRLKYSASTTQAGSGRPPPRPTSHKGAARAGGQAPARSRAPPPF